MKKIILMSFLTMCLATANAQNGMGQVTPPPTVDSNNVYFTVEKMPEFPGGQVELMKYLASNIKYPKDAANAGKQGRVIVRFVVNEDGSISDETLIRGVFPSLDEEALRVIKSMPKWHPGEQDGKKVRVYYTIPISFILPAPGPLRPDDAK